MSRSLFTHFLCAFLLLVAFSGTGLCQDTQYWTNQYGNKTALLGGAVVGGIDDNAMVFYNPAALAFLGNNSISVNANVYRLERITVMNALGNSADFKSNRFAAVPVLIGGLIRSKNPNWKMGYGLMSPVQFDFSATARLDQLLDLVGDDESPGPEAFIGESKRTKSLSELTAMFGAARKLSESWAIGLTHLFTLRTLNYNSNLLTHMLLNDAATTPVSTTWISDVKYLHLRYQAKLGVNYQKDRWHIGLTVTSPSLGVLGSGTVGADLTTTNLTIGEQRTDIFASDRQDKLKAHFKVPLSVGMGLRYVFQKSQLMFSTEYFGAKPAYAILQPDPGAFFRSENVSVVAGSEDLLRVDGGARQVINAAIGYQYALSEDTQLQFSLRNDQSYSPGSQSDIPRINTEISRWNIIHLTMGTTMARQTSSLSLGLLISMGSTSRYETNGNLENPVEEGLLLGNATITDAQYFSAGLLLGYKFNLKRNE
jgi:hypothetical protein